MDRAGNLRAPFALGELNELLVGQDAALRGSFGLHAPQQLALPVLVEVEPKLLGLDPDRVETALLAEDDAALGAHQLGRVRLDRGRVVKLARHGAALSDEQVLPDDRLPRVELVAAQLPHTRRDLAQPLEAEVRPDAVKSFESQRDLADARVAGALAHPVDRAVNPTRARSDGGHRASGCETEVVVTVEVDRDR